MEWSAKILKDCGRFWRSYITGTVSCKLYLEPIMRIPKNLNPRIQNMFIKRFGVYDKVFPVKTTPSRSVPDHIALPPYLLADSTYIAPKIPEKKNINQIRGMRRSCKLAATILASLDSFVKPGVTTDDIDAFIHKLIIEANAYPSPLHYRGFPKSVCTSVNNVAVHGIPDLRPLHDGDIVNVDITVYLKGFHGDCSKTFPVGKVDNKGIDLIAITEECLQEGIKKCGPGVPFCEIGRTISKYAKYNKVTVLPSFCGHGIGEYFHGPPDIFHIYNRYPGLMHPGMTFTVEPAITQGSYETVLLDDGWTFVTVDGARTAQAEHTVLITENGAEILTK